MKSSKNIFLFGILLYFVFYHMFNFLTGLVKLGLTYVSLNQHLYLLLLISLGLFSLRLIIFFKRLFENRKLGYVSISKPLILLIALILLNFGINRYIGFLAATGKNIGVEKLEYLIYPDYVFSIMTIIGLIILYVDGKREEHGK